MQTSALIFDLDGLLIDSEPIWQRVEVDVFGRYGLELTLADTLQTTGLRIDQVVEYWQQHRPGEFDAASHVIQTAVLDQMVLAMSTEAQPMDGACGQPVLLRRPRRASSSNRQRNRVEHAAKSR